eukprot:COSAG05_NODE_2213_length_3383_cov_9.085871_2_plen_410_part_00
MHIRCSYSVPVLCSCSVCACACACFLIRALTCLVVLFGIPAHIGTVAQNQISLRLYSKPVYTAHAYTKELAKRDETLSKTSEAVFARLHLWRDGIARQFDESWSYVLPTYMLFRIAEQLPLSEPALVDVARPLPPLVQHHAKAVVVLIQQVVAGAHDLPVEGSRHHLVDSDMLGQPAVETHGSLSREELFVLASDSTRSLSGNTKPLKRQTWFQILEEPQASSLATILQRKCGGHTSAEGSGKVDQLDSNGVCSSVLSSFSNLEEMAELRLREAMRSGSDTDAANASQFATHDCSERELKPVHQNVVQSVTDLDIADTSGAMHTVNHTMHGGLNGLPVSMVEAYKYKPSFSKGKKSRHKQRRRANRQLGEDAVETAESGAQLFFNPPQAVEAITGAAAPRTRLSGHSIQ